MANLRCLAFDLGAESGRAVLGTLAGGRLELVEIHRFPNEPLSLPDGLHWDALRLFHEIMAGLIRAAREHGRDFDGIAVDTWGVDYGLLGPGGVLLGEPYHYRDHRTDNIYPEAFRRVPREEIYAATGIQFMMLNTLYQLLATKLTTPQILDVADTMLFMPNLLTFYLSGIKANEFSIASTSQLLDMRAKDWAFGLIDRMGLPRRLFQPTIGTGTVLGDLRAEIAEQTGARGRVIAGAGHDTAAAVAAVPAESPGFMYISCGTWSLAGVETDAPVIDERTREAAFTNEGGAGGRIRFLKNIMGLWLVQECRRAWERAGDSYDYARLTRMAAGAPAFRMLLDPDDASFLNPADMPAAIRSYAQRTSQVPPETPGAYVRAALEGLALKYRLTLELLQELLGRRIEVIHMVGGGTRNELLCQCTADATGLPVVAGPVEATAVGNIMVQAMALGAVAGLQEIREIVRRSFPLQVYQPRETGAWEEAYARFRGLL